MDDGTKIVKEENMETDRDDLNGGKEEGAEIKKESQEKVSNEVRATGIYELSLSDELPILISMTVPQSEYILGLES